MTMPAALRLGGRLALMTALLGAAANAYSQEPAVRWQGWIEIAAGGGHRGPWRMNQSDYDYVDDPTVAISDAGVVAVAWADQSRKDIFLQLYAPNGRRLLAEPVNVSRSPATFSWLPRLLLSADASEVFLLWQEIVFSGGSHGGEIFFARSADGGRRFGTPINLSNSRAGDGKGRTTRRYWHNGSLDLAGAADGTLYAAWTEYEGALWLSRSEDRGAHFSEPLRVNREAALPARGPSLAVGADGTVHLAWAVGEEPAADIHFARSSDRGGSFSAPRAVARGDGHADAPKLAVDDEDTVHLVYAESPSGPFERYHIRYTRLPQGADAFDESRQISAAPSDRHESAGFPSLSLDGAGNLFVLWELFADRRGYPQGLGFTSSDDRGRTFAAASILPGSLEPALGFNGSLQGLLMRKLAVNRAGRLAVVNSTFRSGEASRIWLTLGRAVDR